MSAITKSILSVAVLALVGSSFVGCNTVKGAGKDIERGGEKIQSGAEGVQEDIRD